MASMAVRQSLWHKAKQIKQIPAEYPMAFGVVLSGFKTSFSDLLVQKIVERKEKIDWRRNAAFASFGFLYLGGVQYTLYVPIFGRMFPNAAKFAAKPLKQKLKDTRGMFQVIAQTFLDQCVHHPLMYFPAFYCTKEIVMSDKPDIYKVLGDYRKNFTDDMLALWKVWVPATVFNFAFMPMHMRIPFVAGVSLLWTCILSTMRGGDVTHGESLAGGAVTGKSYLLLQEGLDAFNTTPVELDKHMVHALISATGKNRPGIVAGLCQHVANEQGNVTHSKMIRLGSEFVIQLSVAVPPKNAKAFFDSLRDEEVAKGLTITTTILNKRATSEPGAILGVKLHCVGNDKPGMLAALASKMESKGMDLENVSTTLRLGKNGQREFVIDALISSPHLAHAEDLDACVKDISSLEQDLRLTHFDVRVHTK